MNNTTGDRGRRRLFAYVVAAAYRHGLTGERWTPERFAADHLDAYLARYA